MKTFATALLLTAAGLLAGCASSSAARADGPSAGGSSGVAVFGTIDVGVSRTNSR
jgi:hypothetical protein